jgi:hypothetical protein
VPTRRQGSHRAPRTGPPGASSGSTHPRALARPPGPHHPA